MQGYTFLFRSLQVKCKFDQHIKVLKDIYNCTSLIWLQLCPYCQKLVQNIFLIA